MTTGRLVPATGIGGRSENSEEQGDWQRGFCAQHGRSFGAMGRRSADELRDKRFARRVRRVAAVRLVVRKRSGVSSVLDWGRAAQSGARIEGGVLDAQARN